MFTLPTLHSQLRGFGASHSPPLVFLGRPHAGNGGEDFTRFLWRHTGQTWSGDSPYGRLLSSYSPDFPSDPFTAWHGSASTLASGAASGAAHSESSFGAHAPSATPSSFSRVTPPGIQSPVAHWRLHRPRPASDTPYGGHPGYPSAGFTAHRHPRHPPDQVIPMGQFGWD